MRSLYFFLLLLSCLVHAQNRGGILIQTNRGDSLYTNYAMFSGGYYSESAYIRIDDKKGRKLTINEVNHVEGFDQKGDYRYIVPLRRPTSSYTFWGERLEKTERATIYYTDFSSSSWSQTVRLRPSNLYYTFDKSSLTKLNYSNVKGDVSEFPSAQPHMKKSKALQITQAIMYTAGAGMIIYGIAKTFEPIPPDPDGSPGIGGPNLHPTVFVGALFINVPFFMTSAKQKHLRKALMAVE